MGLKFTGAPAIGADLTIEVPSPTYSGLKSAIEATSINPYTNEGPGAPSGDGSQPIGLTETEIDEIQAGLLPPTIPTALIPIMTSNTAPSGTASVSSSWATVDAWNAFDDPITGTIWLSAIGVGGVGWLAYDFGTNKSSLSYTIQGAIDSNVTRTPKNFTIQGWDGSGWDVLDTVVDQTGWEIGEEREYAMSSPGSYSKYKMDITESNDSLGNGFVGVAQWQLYDLDITPPPEDSIAFIPLMTSNTTPSGVAASSSQWSNLDPYHAFDDPITGTIWLSNISVYSGWISYEFGENKTVKSYVIKAAADAQTQRALKTWTLEGWNGSSWIVVDTVTNETGWGNGEERTFTVDSFGSYIKYRLNISATNDAGQGFISVAQWQLYSNDLNA